jgi:fluoroacetyl-CoA thioesterase
MLMIRVGLKNQREWTVEERHLASNWGSGLAHVLATPVLVAFCEECARLAVEPLLQDGQQTVGTSINLRHLAATPPGMKVMARAELVNVEGRRLCFRIEIDDDVERIGEAEHERFIIDVDRFEKRVADKAQKSGKEPG